MSEKDQDYKRGFIDGMTAWVMYGGLSIQDAISNIESNPHYDPLNENKEDVYRKDMPKSTTTQSTNLKNNITKDRIYMYLQEQQGICSSEKVCHDLNLEMSWDLLDILYELAIENKIHLSSQKNTIASKINKDRIYKYLQEQQKVCSAAVICNDLDLDISLKIGEIFQELVKENKILQSHSGYRVPGVENIE